jgi:hypothetical protein
MRKVLESRKFLEIVRCRNWLQFMIVLVLNRDGIKKQSITIAGNTPYNLSTKLKTKKKGKK